MNMLFLMNKTKDQFSWVSSHDLYWENKMYKRKRSIKACQNSVLLFIYQRCLIFTLSQGEDSTFQNPSKTPKSVHNFRKPYIDFIVPDQKFDTLGEGCTKAKSVCLTKNMVTPMSKIWKNLSVDQKDQRCHVVYGWGRQIFQNCPKKTKNH